MRHVFVETNWVVACAAPAHHKIPAALELLNRATSGELKLYLPTISISEARRPIFERFQSRNEADRVRQFLLWARDNKFVDANDEEAARRVLDQMEGRVKADLEKLDEELENLKVAKGVETFNLSQPMLAAKVIRTFLSPSRKRMKSDPASSIFMNSTVVIEPLR